MACSLGDHLPVSRGFSGTTGVTGGGLEYAFDTFEDGLSSPEAATSEHRGLLTRRGGERCVHFRRWNRRIRRGFSDDGDGEECKAEGQNRAKQAGSHKDLLELKFILTLLRA